MRPTLLRTINRSLKAMAPSKLSESRSRSLRSDGPPARSRRSRSASAHANERHSIADHTMCAVLHPQTVALCSPHAFVCRIRVKDAKASLKFYCDVSPTGQARLLMRGRLYFGTWCSHCSPTQILGMELRTKHYWAEGSGSVLTHLTRSRREPRRRFYKLLCRVRSS